MNRYPASLPRATIAVAAVAMTALTLGLSVLPAALPSAGHEAPFPAAAVDALATDAARHVAPIVVYGVREQTTAFEPVRHDRSARKEAS